MSRIGRLALIAVIGCAQPDDARDLVAQVNLVAIRNQPLLDVAVLRVERLKRELRGNLPGWENALRIAESANDELGLPPFTQTQPPGPAWKPSPASLLGIAPFVRARAEVLAREDRLDELRYLIRDERMRYVLGVALVTDRLSQVEAWLAHARTLSAL